MKILIDGTRSLSKRFCFTSPSIMAKSKFEYVKEFEQEIRCLLNCWIVVRLDGKGFHKFTERHEFEKPNDLRGLTLMSRAAADVFQEFKDIVIGFGHSDEYSFVFRKNTNVYNRRAEKLSSLVTSLFSSSYVFHWNEYFPDTKLVYPPAFDSRIILYPTDENLKDYLSWRQADVHINNLYNLCFWSLVLKSGFSPSDGASNYEELVKTLLSDFQKLGVNMNLKVNFLHGHRNLFPHNLGDLVKVNRAVSPGSQNSGRKAELRLRGTLSGEKNELLFGDFGINYNNEPQMFRKGTTLLRKCVNFNGSMKKVVAVSYHCDIIKKQFWDDHPEILKPSKTPEIDLVDGMNYFELKKQSVQKK